MSSSPKKRTAGVKDADLAEIAGHRIETMPARYTHASGCRFLTFEA
jgi:hypothetical protein